MKIRHNSLWKRLLALLLVITMTFTSFDMTAFATAIENTENTSEEEIPATEEGAGTESASTEESLPTGTEEDSSAGEEETSTVAEDEENKDLPAESSVEESGTEGTTVTEGEIAAGERTEQEHLLVIDEEEAILNEV